MGWELVDALQKASAAYPDTRFVFIDGVLDSKTISYANFAQNQGSFLVGVLGAAMADKGSAVEGLATARRSASSAGATFPSSATSSPATSRAPNMARRTFASIPCSPARSTTRPRAAS